MYNFKLFNNEELIKIFDEEYVKQGENEKNTTIVLTNKRVLFMDYIKDDPDEVLRIARGVDYVRYKEVYFTIALEDIEKIEKGILYKVYLKNGTDFEFDNEELFSLLKGNISI